MKRLLDVCVERETPVEFITGVLLACVVGWVFKMALVGWWS